MSKAKGDSNVQAGVVEGRELMSLPLDKILADPENPNIRGDVRDTTGLQDSIREVGVREPVQVREAPDHPGSYYLISGGRRVVAAKRAGFSHVPAIVDEDIDGRSIRRLMLASHNRRDHPIIALDDNGNVVGGDCWAVFHEVEEGTERQEVARLMGITADAAGAYHRLFTECPEIKEKVAGGDMAITVYSLLKHQPLGVKKYVAQKRGKVSARWVRKTLKNWKQIAAKLEERAVEEPEETEIVDLLEEAEYVEYEEQTLVEDEPPAYHLNLAMISLAKLATVELSPTDHFLLGKIFELVKQLRGT